jgi:lysophospholipase L1-like esterase
MITHYLASGFTLLLAFCTLLIPPTFSCTDPVCLQETTDLNNLLQPGAETHRAIASGDWSAPATWQGGVVPANGATVRIPAGIEVRYDVSSTTRIDTIRVDGTFRFANDRDTLLVVDTLFVPVRSGVLEIGTPTAPIPEQFTARILITGDRRDGSNNTLLLPADTKQFGRGVISKGRATMHGADKDSWLTLAGDALAGASSLTLSRAPSGWRVGDVIVVAGTQTTPAQWWLDNPNVPYPTWFSEAIAGDIFQDEELTITAINGNQISFTNNKISTGNKNVLRFNHRRPVGYTRPTGVTADFAIHVGNLSRNITIESETGRNLGLIDTTARRNEIMKRGHAMFMHTTDVDIVNVAFWHLGRTDKHRDLDEVGTNLDGRTGTGTNQRGRYAVHFHRTGTLDWLGQPSSIRGCSVWGSPGWGIAHHEANLIAEDNFVYEVLGTAYMQEAGNEIGTWRRNLSIKIYGGAPFLTSEQPGIGSGGGYVTSTRRLTNFDYGWEGNGFWLHGAGQIAGEDNVAASSAAASIALFGNSDGGVGARFPNTDYMESRLLPAAQRDIARGFTTPNVEVSHVPLRQLRRLVGYNSKQFYFAWGHMLNGENSLFFHTTGGAKTQMPSHPYLSVVEDFLAWGLSDHGIQIEYSSGYLFRDGLVVSTGVSRAGALKINGTNVNLTNLRFENFNGSVYVPTEPLPRFGRDFRASEWRDVVFRFRGTPEFSQYRGDHDYGDYLRLINTRFEATTPAPATPPLPNFSASAYGSLAMRFDATASTSATSGSAARRSRNLIAYAWDFDNDGKPDGFGSIVHHYFPAAGTYPVTLTIWDEQGRSATSTRSINVVAIAYPNAFADGGFDQPADIESNLYYSFDSLPNLRNRRWMTYNTATPVVSGALDLNSVQAAYQVVPDNRMRRGAQTLRLRSAISTTLGATIADQRLLVRLYGVRGEFQYFTDPYERGGGLTYAGARPFEAVTLVNADVGGQAYDWRESTWNIDLGQGYDFLILELTARGTSSTSTTVRIDDVSLTGPGTPVTVAAPANLPPIVTLDVPGRAPTRLQLVATVRDEDGTVTKVEFFDGARKIGERTSAPWTWTVFNASPGMHEYTARATDNQGGGTTSFERYTLVVSGAEDANPPTPVSPPAAPSALAAAAVSGSRINLSWTDNSSDEIGFELERRPATADGVFTQIAYLAPGSTTHADTALPGGTAFAYRIRAINTTDPSAWSAEASASTWTTVAAPAFSPAAGTYETTQTIVLSSATPDAVIRYTLDGGTPSETAGTLYTAPFALASGATVRAIAYRAGFTPSAVASATYSIAEPLWQGALQNNDIPSRDGTLETNLKNAGYTHLLFDNRASNPSAPSWWSGTPGYTQVSGARAAYSWAGLRWAGSDRVPLVGEGDGRRGVARLTITPNVTTATTRRMAVILTTADGSGEASVRIVSIKVGTATTTFDRTLTASAGKASVGEFLLRVRPSEPIEITLDYGGQWSGVSLAFTNTGPATTPTGPPAPAAFSALPDQAGRVSLGWTPADATHTGFTLQYRIAGSSTWLALASPDATARGFTHTGLTAGTTYEYRLVARDASGDSSAVTSSARTWSAANNPIPPAPRPADLPSGRGLATVVMGDSNTEIGNVTGGLMHAYERAYGYFGSGYRGLGGSGATAFTGNGSSGVYSPYFRLSLSGTWQNFYGDGELAVYSPDTTARRSSTAGSRITMDFYGDSARVFYLASPGAGSFRFIVNGTPGATVSTADASVPSSRTYDLKVAPLTGLTLGWNQVHLEVVSGTVSLVGVDTRVGTGSAALVHKWGRSSSATRDHFNVRRHIHEQAAALLAPDLVGTMLGTNDHNIFGISSAQVMRNTAELLDRARAGAPSARLAVFSTLANDVVSGSGWLRAHYLGDWPQLAAGINAGYVNVYARTASDINAYVYPDDRIHFSPTGGAMLGDWLFQQLLALGVTPAPAAPPAAGSASGYAGLPVPGQLYAWLRADGPMQVDADGGVALWSSLAGETTNSFQPVPGWRPKLISNALNGRPAVRFDGVDDHIVANAIGTSSYAVVWRADAAQGALFADGRSFFERFGPGPGDGDNRLLTPGRAETGRWFLNGREINADQVVYPTSGWQILVFVGDGQPTIDLIGTTSYSGGDFFQGARRTWLKGDVAEIIVQGNIPITTTERTAIEDYLSARYGIPLERSQPTAAPTFSPPGGLYSEAQSITIVPPASDATIYYTTSPTGVLTVGNGTLYTGPFSLSTATTVRAIAIRPGQTVSSEVSASYSFGGTGGTVSNLFGNTAATGTTFNDAAYELGMRFTTSAEGNVTALRYWRPANAAATPTTARLWRVGTANPLASVAIGGASSGWQEATLTSPVLIQPGSTYVVSYSVPSGQPYQSLAQGFATARSAGFLTAPVGAGVFSTSPGTLPTGSFNDSNYFADLVFSPLVPLAPTAFTATPAANSIGLTWTAADARPTGYRLESRGDAQSPWTTLVTLPADARAHTHADLSAGTSQNYRLFAVGAGGDSSPALASATVWTAREAWRAAAFGSAAASGTGSAADSADPDGDGLPNLLEYALDLDPLQPGGVATQSALQLTGATPTLSLTFNRARPDLTYVVEASNDLVSWNLIATNPGTVGQSVTVEDSAPASPRRFLRLRVNAP